ncbi:hypothetical protein DET0910 [Dehalococcoides mccartyi 195]|uniref:Uncharacterized protein n=1 Tax=Dehalococcoides mccartyi (strain ATCC BAA-2266 / KCTC 15142 / 195) TaxID=243164 RepID=Q3Z814_DEHM1|nr:hypothetical protein DET0910 [Dehalococcoides mccartyi 195]
MLNIYSILLALPVKPLRFHKLDLPITATIINYNTF